MHPVPNPTIIGSDAEAPVVLLFSPATRDRETFREYLVTQGCTVIVNEYHVTNYRYVFCIGDWYFVKTIFENLPLQMKKPVIISRDYREDGIPSFIQEKAKVAWLGDEPLNLFQMRRVLGFAVVSGETELVLYTQRHPRISSHTLPVTDSSVDKKVTRKNLDEKLIHELVDEKKRQQEISQTITEIFNSSFQKKPVRKKITLSRFARMVIVLIVFFVLPAIFYCMSVGVAIASVWYGMHAFEKGNTKHLTTAMHVSHYWISQSQLLLTYVSIPLKIISFYEPVRTQERLLMLVSDVAEAGVLSGNFLLDSQILVKQLVAQRQSIPTTTPATLLSRGQSIFPKIHEKLGLIDAQIALLLREQPLPFSLPIVVQKLTSLQTHVRDYRSQLAVGEKLLSLYATGGGFGKEVTYLLLLQNSMELRPTGGFIGSIALVTLADGLVSDVRVEDVYAIDGQLRGHVDPPNQIRELLVQEHWYLRDSNWSPDFRESGQQAAWFYEKSTGKKVSGVIGVSMPFVTSILSVVGPVQLPDYTETISADNFFGKSYFYTKSNFFPGSTQKKDFLGSLLTALLTKLSHTEVQNMQLLLPTLAEALGGRSVQFWFADPKLEQLVHAYSWDGRYPAVSGCFAKSACIQDDFGLIEANVSVNKVNYFITRDLKLDTTLSSDGATSHRMTVTWVNKSIKGDTQKGGEYRSYSRVYFPADAEVAAIIYNGRPVDFRSDPQTIPIAPYAEYEERSANEPTEHIAIVHDVPAASTGVLQLSFRKKTNTVLVGPTVVYRFSLQKQSGVEAMPYQVTIQFPSEWQLVGGAQKTSGSYEIRGEVRQPKEYIVEFLR